MQYSSRTIYHSVIMQCWQDQMIFCISNERVKNERGKILNYTVKLKKINAVENEKQKTLFENV